MKPKKTNMVLVLVVFSLGMVVSPVFAHERMFYDPDRKLPPRPIQHSHAQDSEVKTDAQGFNPIQGAAWLVGGIYKAVEGTIKAVFSPPKETVETQEKAAPQHPSANNRTGFRWGWPGQK